MQKLGFEIKIAVVVLNKISGN